MSLIAFKTTPENGVNPLDRDSLKGLLILKYVSTHDAADKLGSVRDICDSFVGFQRGLFRSEQDTNQAAPNTNLGEARSYLSGAQIMCLTVQVTWHSELEPNCRE